MTPKPANVRFYPSAAAAQQAGLPGLHALPARRRPGLAGVERPGRRGGPGHALIADGVVDREGVAGLAARLGYSERQLHRLLVAEVGTGALALARAQRAQTARVLIETTDLPVADVAFAAGFASVRQFNDTVRAGVRHDPDRAPAEPGGAPRRSGRARRRSSGARSGDPAPRLPPTVRRRGRSSPSWPPGPSRRWRRCRTATYRRTLAPAPRRRRRRPCRPAERLRAAPRCASTTCAT